LVLLKSLESCPLSSVEDISDRTKARAAFKFGRHKTTNMDVGSGFYECQLRTS
jgi:hypothetical protein